MNELLEQLQAVSASLSAIGNAIKLKNIEWPELYNGWGTFCAQITIIEVELEDDGIVPDEKQLEKLNDQYNSASRELTPLLGEKSFQELGESLDAFTTAARAFNDKPSSNPKP